jgi:hypothetical protein
MSATRLTRACFTTSSPTMRNAENAHVSSHGATTTTLEAPGVGYACAVTTSATTKNAPTKRRRGTIIAPRARGRAHAREGTAAGHGSTSPTCRRRRGDDLSREEVREVACPACGAPAGECCRRDRGGPRKSNPHPAPGVGAARILGHLCRSKTGPSRRRAGAIRPGPGPGSIAIESGGRQCWKWSSGRRSGGWHSRRARPARDPPPHRRRPRHDPKGGRLLRAVPLRPAAWAAVEGRPPAAVLMCGSTARLGPLRRRYRQRPAR